MPCKSLHIPSYNPLHISYSELQCLAVAMEKEALTEGLHGMRLVANVVIRRSVLSGMSLCKVVQQPKQFSWHKAGQKLAARSVKAERLAREILVSVALGRHVDRLKATHFVTKESYEKIDWKLPRVLVYKNHVFMRED